MNVNQTKENNFIRPPVIVVMGHVDHGKTSILDWYRQTKVVDTESGGITQHIGAYEFEHKGKKITFIDTPGHEAFTKIRSRGARVADIAILVVAGDEGVKPQTKEAAEIIQENNLPIVVALNKLDKAGYNPEKVKQELAQLNILVESYGGKVPLVEISAKTGQNMESLLEMLFLMAELEDLRASDTEPARGVVIEAHLDPRRGITSTLLVLNGKIKKGDLAAIGHSPETIKILENFKGQAVEEATPSSPIIVAGLVSTPSVGDEFRVFLDKNSAESHISSLPAELKRNGVNPSAESTDASRPIFNVILKADVAGSREVLEESIQKLAPEEIGINIIRSEVGNINESDVKLAMATKLVSIIGFKIKIDPAVKDLAEKTNIRIITGDVIYKLLEEIKENLINMLPPVVKRVDTGRVRILKTFKKDGDKQIIGGRVEDGWVEKGDLAEIKRKNESVGHGKLNQLQKDKANVNEVQKGFEFGMMLESPATVQEGDYLEIFKEELTRAKI